ncbi:hypothetical protein [Salicibibacter kimchii]|uniref:hypothetical protein n=1 Tax=Salicibibacter kimchii TaxID=2099786 RepID=UPI0013966E6B|nr:hypothetical protein [Salicibibacter kimchii]
MKMVNINPYNIERRLRSLSANGPETSAVNNYLQMLDHENVFVVGALAYRQPMALKLI